MSRISNITTPAGLRLPGAVYVPSTALELLRSGDLKEKWVREEYTRLRSIINKRVARAEKVGLDLYSAAGMKITKLPKLSELKNTRELVFEIAGAKSALQSERGTVGRVREFFQKNPDYMEKVKETVRRLNKGKVKVSTETGMNIFTSIMDSIRAAKAQEVIGSPLAAQVAEQAEAVLETGGSLTKNEILQIFRDTLDDYDIPLDIQGDILKAFVGEDEED